MAFMAPLFDKEPGSDIPSSVDFTQEIFDKYKSLWLLWRALGHETDSGRWVAPLSFSEALRFPKQMIDFFLDMDGFLGRMKIHNEKKRKGSSPPRGKK